MIDPYTSATPNGWKVPIALGYPRIDRRMLV